MMFVHSHKRKKPTRGKDLKRYLNSLVTFEGTPRRFAHNRNGTYAVLIEDLRRGTDHLAEHVWVDVAPGIFPITAMGKPVKFVGVVRKYMRRNGQEAYCVVFDGWGG